MGVKALRRFHGIARLALLAIGSKLVFASCGSSDSPGPIAAHPAFPSLDEIPETVDVNALSGDSLSPSCQFGHGEPDGVQSSSSSVGFTCTPDQRTEGYVANFATPSATGTQRGLVCKASLGLALCDLTNGTVVIQVQAKNQDEAMSILGDATNVISHAGDQGNK
jgi:hypothetical protein